MTTIQHIEANKITNKAPSYLAKGLDYIGDIRILETSKKVSIIGSREPTEIGANAAKSITQYLTKNNITTVSGLALGIDSIVHKTTLENNGNNIAVIGSSIDIIYPKQNAILFENIKEKGLLLSQFPIGTKTKPYNFPLRNRTMAFLSDITIVCDATAKSGTKHQVAEALKLGRKVYILQHIIEEFKIPWAIKAIEKGAIVLNPQKLEPLLQ